MKAFALALALTAGLASAQVQVQVALPSISWTVAPPLVVVEPGVQVVSDYGEEVFFVDGYYWHRRGPHWYRAADYRGGWVVVDRGIPGSIVRYQPGAYRHWRGGPGRGNTTVIVNPPGPGRVKIKSHGGGKHH